MNNTGKKLVTDGIYDGPNGRSQFNSLIARRTDDVPIIGGLKPTAGLTFPVKQDLNNRRASVWKFISAVLWSRFKWTSDLETFRSADYWKSFYNEYTDGSIGQIEGDCEDLALTAIEFALFWNIEPRHLYVVQCLGAGGQSYNRTRRKSERRVLDHCVAAMDIGDGEFLLIDSSERNETETIEECRLDFYNWHRMDWPTDYWERCKLIGPFAEAEE